MKPSNEWTQETETALKLWMLHQYQIIRKALMDGSFKTRLLRSPAEAFREVGAVAPAGVEIKVLENTKTTMYFALPPSAGTLTYQQVDLTDDDLKSGVRGVSTMALFDDFDIRRPRDAKVGNKDTYDPKQRDNDMKGDPDTIDHGQR